MYQNPTLFDYMATASNHTFSKIACSEHLSIRLAEADRKFPFPLPMDFFLQLNQKDSFYLVINEKDSFPDVLDIVFDASAYLRSERVAECRKFSFDMGAFRKELLQAVRLGDDAIEVRLGDINHWVSEMKKSSYPFEEKKKTRKLWLKLKSRLIHNRQIVLHLLNEEKVLEALGFGTDTPYAVAFSQELHRQFLIGAYQGTVDLAKERGTFPEFRSINELKNPVSLLLQQMAPSLYDKMVLYGRRNNLKLNF